MHIYEEILIFWGCMPGHAESLQTRGNEESTLLGLARVKLDTNIANIGSIDKPGCHFCQYISICAYL